MPDRPPLEVADVIRAHGPAFLAQYGSSLSLPQRRALSALARCRTAALGGHVERCDHCGLRLIAYNSCRNRHCPKCQAGRAAAWLEREASSLLPVEYHHVVFTLPHELAPLALQNQAAVYGLLFRAAADTLRCVAADPKRLGAELGVVAVLHTWGQTLQHHPHLHCVVTGGGLAVDDKGRRCEPPRWVSCRPGFFLPVHVLGALFRGKFLAGLRQAHAAGRLTCCGRLAHLADPVAFAALLRPLYAKRWVVYSKPPFAGAEVVLKYLARYARRGPFANSRLRALADGRVTFTYRDYARVGKERLLTLPAVEFLRRFLQHVLPKGFVKVRHYGLLANGGREQKLAACRWLLALAPLAALAAVGVVPASADPGRCPVCGVGLLSWVEELPGPGRGRRPSAVAGRDTS
jgi:hypothetical protein